MNSVQGTERGRGKKKKVKHMPEFNTESSMRTAFCNYLLISLFISVKVAFCPVIKYWNSDIKCFFLGGKNKYVFVTLNNEKSLK